MPSNSYASKCGQMGSFQLTAGTIDSNMVFSVLTAPLLVHNATAPTSLSVNQTLAEGNVTLSWSGAAGGTSNSITGYNVQFSDSTNNSTWGAWQDLTTISTTATSGSISVAPPTVRGNFRRFRMQTFGTAGASFASGWRTSTNSVRRNTIPSAPTAVIANGKSRKP